MISKLEYYKFSLDVNRDAQRKLIQPDENVRAANEDALAILYSQQDDLYLLACTEMAVQGDDKAIRLLMRYILDAGSDAIDNLMYYVDKHFLGWNNER